MVMTLVSACFEIWLQWSLQSQLQLVDRFWWISPFRRITNATYKFLFRGKCLVGYLIHQTSSYICSDF